MPNEPLLHVDNITVTFRARHGRTLHAVDRVSLHVHRGQTVGLVGESGAGKSTVALTIMRAHRHHSGRIHFDGEDITDIPERDLVPIRRRMQMIFQDPYASLNPRMPVGRIIAEPLRIHRIPDDVDHLLTEVGLDATAARKYPAHFSGGQRQRIAIARALALQPDLVIADEPVSALDVSIQAQIINLLRTLQEKRRIAYLIISHDLALIHHIAEEIVVMYLGRIVEHGPTDQVVNSPQHPYTAALLSATPMTGRRRIILPGDPPSPINRPTGCPFHPRCPISQPRCTTEEPPLAEVAPQHRARCFFPGQLAGPIAL